MDGSPATGSGPAGVCSGTGAAMPPNARAPAAGVSKRNGRKGLIMATIDILDPVRMIAAVLGDLDDNTLYEEIFTATDTTLSFGVDDDGDDAFVFTLTGTGFTFDGTPGEDDFMLTGGTVSDITYARDGGDPTAAGTGFDVALTDLNDAVTGNELDAFLSVILAGDDVITGSDERDALAGGDGNDVLDGAGGRDRLAGGEGDDIYIVTRGDKIFEEAGAGTDTVEASGSYRLRANLENLDLVGSGPAKGNGNRLDNIITGNDAANKLAGRDGDDTLDGAGGRDKLKGGLGDDILIGGDGTDVLRGGDGEDVFVFQDLGASDIDRIRDFEIGEDLIDLSAVAGIADFDDVLAQADQVGKHIVLSTDNDSDLIIRKTDLADLDAASFIFAV